MENDVLNVTENEVVDLPVAETTKNGNVKKVIIAGAGIALTAGLVFLAVKFFKGRKAKKEATEETVEETKEN